MNKAFGLMRCGATQASSSAASNIGQMRCGAQPQNLQKPEEIEDEKEQIKELEILQDEIKSSNENWNAKHVLTLKKEALERGYTGTKFDKVTLINFLENYKQ